MTRRTHRGAAALVVVMMTGASCGGGRSEDGPSGLTGVGAGSGEDSTGVGGSTGKADAPMTEKLDLGDDEATSGPGGESGECAAVTATSDVQLSPADIVFVVDNSGSMQFEANAVQTNLNAFSSQITLANLDARVVLLSAYPPNDAEGICVEPPLGVGMCPDEDNNPPGYTHVDQSIDSTDALARLIERWDDYASVLRDDAVKHVVVVSDDDSSVSEPDFMAQFTALDPANAEVRVHGIVADSDPVTACLNGNPCCGISAARGAVYLNLINQTGGLFGNLCSQQFQPIFDELATQVIEGAALACSYEIPEPPEGEDFDPDEVNVEFDDGSGGTLAIGRVDSAAECANVTNGWYYDDLAAPTQILLCEQTCGEIQGFTSASISIAFGCATVPAG